jgi:hypothetical protein
MTKTMDSVLTPKTNEAIVDSRIQQRRITKDASYSKWHLPPASLSDGTNTVRLYFLSLDVYSNSIPQYSRRSATQYPNPQSG